MPVALLRKNQAYPPGTHNTVWYGGFTFLGRYRYAGILSLPYAAR
jgi:hypothetical protein